MYKNNFTNSQKINSLGKVKLGQSAKINFSEMSEI